MFFETFLATAIRNPTKKKMKELYVDQIEILKDGNLHILFHITINY